MVQRCLPEWEPEPKGTGALAGGQQAQPEPCMVGPKDTNTLGDTHETDQE